jgi:hypothetical protein
MVILQDVASYTVYGRDQRRHVNLRFHCVFGSGQCQVGVSLNVERSTLGEEFKQAPVTEVLTPKRARKLGSSRLQPPRSDGSATVSATIYV